MPHTWMQVVWGELGDSALDCLAVLSTEVAVPLLKSQIRHGRMPDAAALDLTDSLQSFVSSCKHAGSARPVCMGASYGQVHSFRQAANGLMSC